MALRSSLAQAVRSPEMSGSAIRKGVGQGLRLGGQVFNRGVKDLAGYGPGGPLQGQKLLDSSTRKPFLTPGLMKPLINAGYTKEQLGQKYALPGLISRIPGMAPVQATLNSVARNRFVHPVAQVAQTAGNIFMNPLTKAVSDQTTRGLRVLGQNRQGVAGKALTGTARVVDLLGQGASAASKAFAAGGVAATGYSTYRNALSVPETVAYGALRSTYPNVQFRNDVEPTRAPTWFKLDTQPERVVLDIATDPSQAGSVAREIAIKSIPHMSMTSAYQNLQDRSPLSRVQRVIRNNSLFGHASLALQRAVADHRATPPEEVIKDVLSRRGIEALTDHTPSPTLGYVTNLASEIGAIVSPKDTMRRTWQRLADPNFAWRPSPILNLPPEHWLSRLDQAQLKIRSEQARKQQATRID